MIIFYWPAYLPGVFIVCAYGYLFENKETTDNLVIVSTRRKGSKMREAYGIEEVAQGVDVQGGFHWYDNPVIVILERFYTYETVYSYAKGTKSCSRLKCVWKVNLPTETSHNGS